jgi:hypothetical protein
MLRAVFVMLNVVMLSVMVPFCQLTVIPTRGFVYLQ